MRRFVISSTLLIAVGFGAIGFAQTKIATAEDYQKTMKTAATAYPGANKALGSGGAADAKAQLATARTNFMALMAFWLDKKTPDAAGFVKDLITNLDAADKALSAATPDVMAAQASLKMGAQSCGSCHQAYREGDGTATPDSMTAGIL